MRYTVKRGGNQRADDLTDAVCSSHDGKHIESYACGHEASGRHGNRDGPHESAADEQG